ncbi:MAG: hypothetical protein AAFY60_11725, partial [Myxococcota bacterium]
TLLGGDLVFTDNVVIAGGPSSSHTALSLRGDGTTVVADNLLMGGSTDGFITALQIQDTQSVRVHNNVLIGGLGNGFTTAVSVRGDSTAYVRNNLLHGGFGNGVPNPVELTGSAVVTIENNILTSRRSSNSCVERLGPETGGFLIANNSVFNCGAFFTARDATTGCEPPGICAQTLGEFNAVSGVANNVSVPPVFSSFDPTLFLSIAEYRTMNYRLAPAGNAGLSVGLNGNDEADWSFNVDRDGRLRPASGTPWTLGPYEP